MNANIIHASGLMNTRYTDTVESENVWQHFLLRCLVLLLLRPLAAYDSRFAPSHQKFFMFTVNEFITLNGLIADIAFLQHRRSDERRTTNNDDSGGNKESVARISGSGS